jgi:formylglycine-generating enzyme required for sulfatase activity
MRLIARRELPWVLVALASGCSREKSESPMNDIKKLIDTQAQDLKFKLGEATWEFVRITPGAFLMGSPAGEPGRETGEVPQLGVTISQPYYLGKFEVTQLQWKSIMGDNPSENAGDELAVDQIQYPAALTFCRKLATALAVKVTLPTEAQWEYACRAGTKTRFYSGSDEADLKLAAWFDANAEGKVHAVGQKEPNAWGLYDMLGNLYEPCIDYIVSFAKLKERDPEGNRFSDMGAMRGGFYMDAASRCRSAFRSRTSDRFGGMGVRLAINL